MKLRIDEECQGSTSEFNDMEKFKKAVVSRLDDNVYEVLIKKRAVDFIKYSEAKIEDKKNGLDWVIRDEADLKDYFRRTLDAHADEGGEDVKDDSKVEKLRETLMKELREKLMKEGIAGVSTYNTPLAVEIYCLLCKNKYTLQEAKQLLSEVEKSFERMLILDECSIWMNA